MSFPVNLESFNRKLEDVLSGFRYGFLALTDLLPWLLIVPIIYSLLLLPIFLPLWALFVILVHLFQSDLRKAVYISILPALSVSLLIAWFTYLVMKKRHMRQQSQLEDLPPSYENVE